MQLRAWISHLWRTVFRRRLVERELNEELNAFLEELIARKVRAGTSPERAREEIIPRVGDLDQIRDRILRERHAPVRKATAFALVGIVFFALGAGTAVVGSWIDPARLESLLQRSPQAPEPTLPSLKVLVSVDDLPVYFRRLTESFDDLPFDPSELAPRTFSVNVTPFFDGMALDPDSGLPLPDSRVSPLDGASGWRDRQGRWRMDMNVGWSYTLRFDRETQRLTGTGARRLWPVSLER